jgi:hypothetical protein
MPIVTLQRQFRELGRIRLGQQVEWEKNGRSGKRPAKLKTFRLTSPQRELLDHAAELYGGTVEAWPEAPDGDAWQLVTTVDAVDIIVPPANYLSQWNELYAAGGCLRRCDGVRDWLNNVPCQCPADPAERNELAQKGEACKPTTRLSVILPALPDLGTWMLVSHGYYAAVELAGAADLLAAATNAGQMIPARLAIGWKVIKRPNEPRRDFPIPQIRIAGTLAQLGEGNGHPAIQQLAAGAPAGRPMGQPALPEGAPLPADPSFSSTATRVAVATASPVLSTEGLASLLDERGFPRQYAVTVAKRLFPDAKRFADLTDEQRAAIWQEITSEPAG